MTYKILVADKEPYFTAMLKREIEAGFSRDTDHGVTVIIAADGREALDMAIAETPNLIILDIMMPVLDGREVLNQLGYRLNTRRIPVIVLTAMTDHRNVSMARGLGVKDYLIKPFDIKSFDPSRLLASIYRALRIPVKAV